MTERQNFTFQEQIECVNREILMRLRVYPNWIAQKRMTEQKADYEIACMKAVLRTLENLNRQYEEHLRKTTNA